MRSLLTEEYCCYLKKAAFGGAVLGGAGGVIFYMAGPTAICSLITFKCVSVSSFIALPYNTLAGSFIGAGVATVAANTFSLFNSAPQQPPQIQNQPINNNAP